MMEFTYGSSRIARNEDSLYKYLLDMPAGFTVQGKEKQECPLLKVEHISVPNLGSSDSRF